MENLIRDYKSNSSAFSTKEIQKRQFLFFRHNFTQTKINLLRKCQIIRGSPRLKLQQNKRQYRHGISFKIKSLSKKRWVCYLSCKWKRKNKKSNQRMRTINGQFANKRNHEIISSLLLSPKTRWRKAIYKTKKDIEDSAWPEWRWHLFL